MSKTTEIECPHCKKQVPIKVIEPPPARKATLFGGIVFLILLALMCLLFSELAFDLPWF
jgi:hypothetical protein